MNEKLLLLPIIIPAISALLITTLNFKSRTQRNIFIESCVILNTLAILLLVIYPPSNALTLFRFSERAGFSLRLDGLGMVFAVLIAVLWPLTTLYAFEYMSHEHRETSFFGWFVLTYGVVSGIALSSDLLTLYLFYEIMTLTTLPLVMHEMDGRARYAGRKYLTYSVAGAACAFIALTYAMSQGGGESFTLGGTFGIWPNKPDNMLLAAWFLGFLGFGVKAAVFPFHGWLPSASVAPTPVTALLHAVAVVKAGVFAVIRLTWYVFEPETLAGTWAQYAAFTMVCITIIYGSSMALATQHLKRRFAYSTISQLSYILLGVLLLTPEGLTGALTHMGGHAVMKINLFFCAGAVLCQTEREYLFDMRGLGLGMPKTFLALLISGLALCGLPPSAGFMGKWQLGTASAAVGMGHAGIAMLMVSAVLTVLYVFSIFSIFIMPGQKFDFKTANRGVKDPGYEMLVPLGILAAGSFLYGMYSEPLINFFGKIAQGVI
ncbi:MAG: hypothetical protein IKQ95_05880 [Synergistaceae bacterium]|nr:hypothetical protein [Synergistaceae bacterium]